MRQQVVRCDVCGADDSPANPVNVVVSGVQEAKKPKRKRDAETSPFGFVISFGEAVNSIDLCQSCGSGMIAILRQRYPPKPKQPQPTPETAFTVRLAKALKVEVQR